MRKKRRCKLKKRILIADDEKALLHTMAFTLKRKGLDVETAADGDSAFKNIMETFSKIILK